MFNDEALPDGQREGGWMVPGAGLRRSGGVKLMFVSFVRSVFVCFNPTAKNCIFMICCNPVKIKILCFSRLLNGFTR